MDSGLASASLRRPGMTRLTKVDTLASRVLTQAGLGPAGSFGDFANATPLQASHRFANMLVAILPQQSGDEILGASQ